METTPENITHLKPNEIFVFGSNYAGRHGKGAALTALKKFGARNGQGMGLMSQSYGIATKGWQMDVLPLPRIGVQIEHFLRFAHEHPELKFFVTEIGCGLAGYSPCDIAPLFGQDAPSNVILPASFLQHTKKALAATKDADGWLPPDALPDKVGLWYFRCDENGNIEERLAITSQGKQLIVHCADLGAQPLKHYHDGLSNPRWKHLA